MKGPVSGPFSFSRFSKKRKSIGDLNASEGVLIVVSKVRLESQVHVHSGYC